MQWKIMQQNKPMDIVISTNQQYSVRQFIEECCRYVSWNIKWRGNGKNEIGYIIQNKKEKIIVKVNSRYFRPNELESLKGKSLFAKKKLKIKLKYSFKDIVKEMMQYDLNRIKNEKNR